MTAINSIDLNADLGEFRTEEECLQFFRDAEINKLNAQIFELNEYAKAQSEVINNWIAKPLIKIKEVL